MEEVVAGVVVSLVSSLLVSTAGFVMLQFVYRERMDRLRAEFDEFKASTNQRFSVVAQDVESKLDGLKQDMSDVNSKLERLLGYIEGIEKKGN